VGSALRLCERMGVIRLSIVSPGVRRLCVCVCAPHPGLLDRACKAAGCRGLYTERFPEEGIDLGFASPGVDEAVLVPELITALSATAAEASACCAMPCAPALAVFHVGITRVEGDDLRGAAVIRIRELLRELTRAASSGTVPEGVLVVGITAGLFDDIGAECDFNEGWTPLAAPPAWCRAY
jgi:hypothetical protein